jgi:NAD(P)-dependent dehydrogenase (short-subunit alcohol dehydrogenase family)
VEIEGRVAVVTGGGGGIGRALAGALVAAGARVLVADLDGEAVAAAAGAIARRQPGVAISARADVANESELAGLIELAERELGAIDVFFANAGVTGEGGLSDDDDWAATIEVNLMAHVRAARLLVPTWLERGGGYFVSTASAAGLLSQIGLAPYAVTKHAAVAFAEWLAITYGSRGIRVSCLCPMGVDTKMLNAGLEEGGGAGVGRRVVASAGEVLSPDVVADCVLEGIAAERFLILPHPEVLEFHRRKSSDYDRWLAGMRRLQGRIEGA